jgi:hypothetical protein
MRSPKEFYKMILQQLELRKSLGVVPIEDCWVEQWWDFIDPCHSFEQFCEVIQITVGLGANDFCRHFA